MCDPAGYRICHINSGTGMSTLISTYSTKYFTGWTTMSGIQLIHIRFLLFHAILLVWDSIHRYLHIWLISFPTSSLYSFHRIGSLMTSYLVICLQAFGCYATERAQRYLSNGWTDKSQSWFMWPNNLPSEKPESHLYNHPVTKWRLMSTNYSSGRRE